MHQKITKDTERYQDPSNLGELYPVPKTFEELEQMDADREALYKKRRPRKPRIKIAAFSSILLIGALLLSVNLEGMWFFGQLVGVTLSFIILMALFFLGWAWYSYAFNVFYAYVRPFQFFLFMFLLLTSAHFILGIFLDHQFTQIGFMLILATGLLHTLIIFILLKFFLKLDD